MDEDPVNVLALGSKHEVVVVEEKIVELDS